MMRRREESFGTMPGEFEDAGDQQEQKEGKSRSLAYHQGKTLVTARERERERKARRRGNGGERGRQEKESTEGEKETDREKEEREV